MSSLLKKACCCGEGVEGCWYRVFKCECEPMGLGATPPEAPYFIACNKVPPPSGMTPQPFVFLWNNLCWYVSAGAEPVSALPGNAVVVPSWAKQYRTCEECCEDQGEPDTPLEECPEYDPEIHPDQLRIMVGTALFTLNGNWNCSGTPPCHCYDEDYGGSFTIDGTILRSAYPSDTNYLIQCLDGDPQSIFPDGDYGFCIDYNWYCGQGRYNVGIAEIICTKVSNLPVWRMRLIIYCWFPECFNERGSAGIWRLYYEKPATTQSPGPVGNYTLIESDLDWDESWFGSDIISVQPPGSAQVGRPGALGPLGRPPTLGKLPQPTHYIPWEKQYEERLLICRGCSHLCHTASACRKPYCALEGNHGPDAPQMYREIIETGECPDKRFPQ